MEDVNAQLAKPMTLETESVFAHQDNLMILWDVAASVQQDKFTMLNKDSAHAHLDKNTMLSMDDVSVLEVDHL